MAEGITLFKIDKALSFLKEMPIFVMKSRRRSLSLVTFLIAMLSFMFYLIFFGVTDGDIAKKSIIFLFFGSLMIFFIKLELKGFRDPFLLSADEKGIYYSVEKSDDVALIKWGLVSGIEIADDNEGRYVLNILTSANSLPTPRNGSKYNSSINFTDDTSRIDFNYIQSVKGLTLSFSMESGKQATAIEQELNSLRILSGKAILA